MRQKIFDVIFFYNEVELLNRRLEYLSPFVTEFIILNFGPIHLNTIQDNVVIHKLNFRKKPFFKNNFLEYLFYLFDFEDVKYDDFFLFSKVDEIPNLQTLIDELDPKNFVPLILNHKSYAWSHKLVNSENYYGTRVFQFTNFLQNKSLHTSLYHSNPLMWKANILDNGYKLFGFQPMDILIGSQNFWFENTSKQNENLYKLFEHFQSISWDEKVLNHNLQENSELPNLFHDLSYEFEETKKFELFIDLDYRDNQIKYLFGNKEYVHEIEFPHKTIYSEKKYTDFLEDFKKNEVLTIVKKYLTSSVESVKIKKTTETVVLTVEEIINSVPSELF